MPTKADNKETPLEIEMTSEMTTPKKISVNPLIQISVDDKFNFQTDQ